ncbi:MAG: UDP binding domain-containing protein [Pseudomonadota bacterium]
MPDVHVGFVGMTHLGLVSATACASKGFSVLCVDPDEGLVAALQAGQLPVSEPDLGATLEANGERQRFSAEIADLCACDVVYIAPDVPTDDDGTSDLAGITQLIDSVTPHLNVTAALVVLCQVPPGFTSGLDFPAARRYYQVETLIFGRAMERALYPERYIVGCADPDAEMHAAFRRVLDAGNCPILPMRFESAELTKISINMCLVSSVSVANTMAELCEHIGADWSEIVPALKLDARIGQSAYLKPGLGIAGGNLERDLATVVSIADERGTDVGVVRAWTANSQYRKAWAARTLEREGHANGDDPIAVWGLAYKENTHSTKNSPSVATLNAFPSGRFNAYDPEVSVASLDHAGLSQASDPLAALDGAAALMILTPWPEFRTVDPNDIAARLSGQLVIDPYAVLQARACERAGLRYLTLGVTPVHRETSDADS